MVRATPSPAQNFLSSIILPCLSIFLLPISLAAVAACILHDRLSKESERARIGEEKSKVVEKGCVIISGGRMSKGLTLARAFTRAGWKVIGVEEEGWGELCPMRFSKSIQNFYLLPSPSKSYKSYSEKLISVAQKHNATLFIPVSGAGSSVEDADAAEEMFRRTEERCRTFIQDPETMLDLHDKDRFMGLVQRLGMVIPGGRMVKSVDEAMGFLGGDGEGKGELNRLKRGEGKRMGDSTRKGDETRDRRDREPKYVLKCMGLDENRGDMTLFPLRGDDEDLRRTRGLLEGLKLPIAKDCPYVFQEYIPGQEWCTKTPHSRP